ncbi:MAG: hypothetical protein CMH41_03705 [Micrococcales bacterium]|nr:hypothetical protein [Micrococcales bacterium]
MSGFEGSMPQGAHAEQPPFPIVLGLCPGTVGTALDCSPTLRTVTIRREAVVGIQQSWVIHAQTLHRSTPQRLPIFCYTTWLIHRDFTRQELTL